MTQTQIDPDMAERIDEMAHESAQHLVDKRVTASQVRQVYDKIRQAQVAYEDGEPDAARTTLILLKSKLAYRDEDDDDEPLLDIFGGLIDAFAAENGSRTRYTTLAEAIDDDASQLQVLFELAEGIVGYHKYEESKHGGR